MSESSGFPEPKITRVLIEYAKDLWDFSFLGGSARACLTFEDGTKREFAWFHDEVTFTEKDFFGHTMREVQEVFRERDLSWLRS